MLERGIKKSINWDKNQACHWNIQGKSGSGKTYFCKFLLAKISLYEPTSQLYMADFKGDGDFSFLNAPQVERFYRYDKSGQALQDVYNILVNRQQGIDESRNLIILYFDELAAYINSLSYDKKLMESEKQKISYMLMIARSFNIQLIIAQQRADAILYAAGARDNFGMVLGLGTLSEEAKQMMFSEFKKDMLPQKRGTGYLLINNAKLYEVKVPTVTDMDKLNQTILEGVTR